MSGKALDAWVVELGDMLGAGAFEQVQARVAACEGVDPLRFELGTVALLAATQDPGAALPHAERALALAPDEPVVLQYLAVVYRMMGQLDRAIEIAQKAAVRDSSVRSYNMLARILLDAGRYAEAEASLRRALEWEPRSPVLLSALAAACQGQGDQGQALTYLARAYDVNPEDSGPLKSLSDLYAERGWALGAMALARRALDRPQSDEVKVTLGLLLMSLARYLSAEFPSESMFPEADEIADGLVADSESRSPAVQIMVARNLYDAGRIRQANVIAERVSIQTLTTPERANLTFLRGLLDAHEGDVESALELYEDALRLDGNRWEACTNALNLLLAQGDAAATAKMGELLDLVPDLVKLSKPPLLFNQALWLIRTGRIADARGALEHVDRICQHHPELGELGRMAREKLAEVTQ